MESQFRDGRQGFTRAELDEISPERPVFLQVDYSHGYVNTRALERAGIKAVDEAAAQ